MAWCSRSRQRTRSGVSHSSKAGVDDLDVAQQAIVVEALEREPAAGRRFIELEHVDRQPPAIQRQGLVVGVQQVGVGGSKGTAQLAQALAKIGLGVAAAAPQAGGGDGPGQPAVTRQRQHGQEAAGLLAARGHVRAVGTDEAAAAEEMEAGEAAFLGRHWLSGPRPAWR